MKAAALCCVLLSGCNGVNALLEQAAQGAQGVAPVVRAYDGGTAVLTLIVCPRTTEGAEGLKAFLDEMVQYQSELVAARNGGSARLTLNLCPAEAWLTTAPPGLFTRPRR